MIFDIALAAGLPVIIKAAPYSAWYWKMLPAIPTVAVSIVAIWAVHALTKRRERERAVFRLYAVLSDMVGDACLAASNRWRSETDEERVVFIAETIWRLNQVGAIAQQLKLLSNVWRFGGPLSTAFIINCPIDVGKNLIDLRKAITNDPFMDRSVKGTYLDYVLVEQLKGGFLTNLSTEIGNWEQRIECSRQ